MVCFSFLSSNAHFTVSEERTFLLNSIHYNLLLHMMLCSVYHISYVIVIG